MGFPSQITQHRYAVPAIYSTPHPHLKMRSVYEGVRVSMYATYTKPFRGLFTCSLLMAPLKARYRRFLHERLAVRLLCIHLEVKST